MGLSIAATALMPLTSAVSLTIYLATSSDSPLKQGGVALPTSHGEGLVEKDPFDIQDEAVMRDGTPVNPDGFWNWTSGLKWGLLISLLPPFALNIALLVTQSAVEPSLLMASHIITLLLVIRYLGQRDTASHWPTTIHLAVGVFVQFSVLSTFALLPNYPFPEPADRLLSTGASLLMILPMSAIEILSALLPVLHLPPLALLLAIRRGPPLHLPVSVIYPTKITEAIPSDHPSLDAAVPNVTEEVQCTIPEWLLFGYATNVIRHGYYAETMDVWDLPIVGTGLRALPQYLNMRRIYGTREKGRGEGYNLLWKTAKANMGYLLAQQILAALVAFAYYVPHFLLQKLLEYLQNDPTRTSIQWGWLLCFGLFMSNALVYIASGVIWSISSTILQGRIKLQLNTLLFSKTLRKKDVSAAGEESQEDDEEGVASKSQIMTLFTVDVDRVTEFVFQAFAIVDAPIEIAVATIYLLKLLGPSAAYGLLASILCIPINHFASKVVVNAQDNLMKSRDQRTALMNEVLQGIRMLKFMAWERSFERRIDTIRERELHWQARNYQIEVCFNIIWAITPVLVTVVAFLHYTLVAGKTLTPALGFTAVSVFAELRYALNALPETFIDALQSFVSCKRIEKYLAFAEVDQHRPYTGDGDITLNNATFAWPRDDSGSTAPTPAVGFTLSDLTVRFPKRSLSLICGRLGSGKSLLLNGLLGEADLVAGHMNCPRSRPDAMANVASAEWVVEDLIAYVPQQAWLQNASIRDNITFSSPFDQQRYDTVLEACSLLPDLAIMEDGDQTEIGEKGLNLSGGQKARVSLARAVYSRAGILMLDDVLSAVDAHTAHAIMEKCLTGPIMDGRTILLVSHHTALVSPSAAYIVALENGDVKFAGTRAEFVECGLMNKLDEVPESPIEEKTVILENKHKSLISLAETETEPNSETTSIAESTLNDNVPVKQKTPRKLVEDEKRATGRIAWAVWKTYFSALGGPAWWIIFVFTQLVTMILPIVDRWWLQYWTSSDPVNPQHSSTYYVLGYAIITLGGSFLSTGVFVAVYYGSIQASRLLHSNMLQSVLFAKLRFHDTTSRGRLLNRFGKDVEGLDSKMADNFSKSLEYGLSVIATFASIAWIGGWPFLGAGCIILVLYYQAGSIYSTTSRDMRRLDSVTRSPLYSLFGETVSGVAVYRAFGASTIALHDMVKLADTNILAFAWTWTVNRWLSARCNLLSSFLVGIIAVIVLIAPGVTAGMAGFALAFANTISHDLLFVVRRFVQLEQSMVALERIKEYSELPLEAAEFIEPRPKAEWPAHGAIEVRDLVIRYAPELPNVLHGINFKVKPREKIGVVGSTGCGKSTLALSFFRFVEAHEGQILIDNVDISKIGLTDLRSRVTIIPQDPTILSGTLRSTLDVFDEYDDADIYEALRRVHLLDDSPDEDARNKNVFRDLNNPVSEGGDNFSSGEKQLICMARAILKRNKVLFMDEATASIDYETDELISKTIRKEFSDSTILTIAHRLHTIIDFDRVLVMDKGRVAEFASPAELLRDHKSRFYALCRATGRVEFSTLKSLATKAERERKSSSLEDAR